MKSGDLLDGRYRLLKPIGKGGMGDVWEGFDERLRRRVAIKRNTMPIDLTDEARRKHYAHVRQEALNTVKLNDHPNIVMIYDLIPDSDDQMWIIMKLVEHPTLQQYIETIDRPFTQAEGVNLAKHLIEVFKVIHTEGITHRDVKPSNILRRNDGSVVVIDFGIAEHPQNTAISTHAALKGTPSYMAPECMSQQTGPAADIWAIGVVLYYVLTGISPFARDTIPGTLTAILHDTPPALPFTGVLRTVIEGFLCKNPDERMTLQTAWSLLETIEAPTATAPVKSPVQDKIPAAFTKKRKVLRIGGTLLTLVVLAGGGYVALDDNSRTPGVATPSPGVSSSAATSTSPSPSTTPSPAPSPTYRITPNGKGNIYTDSRVKIELPEGWTVRFSGAEVMFDTPNGDVYTVKSLGVDTLESATSNQFIDDKRNRAASEQATPTYGVSSSSWTYTTPDLYCKSKTSFPCAYARNWTIIQRRNRDLLRFILTKHGSDESDAVVKLQEFTTRTSFA